MIWKWRSRRWKVRPFIGIFIRIVGVWHGEIFIRRRHFARIRDWRDRARVR